MKHQSQANASYILCVDSDLDYILGKRDFNAEHYILQTYTYSWENHYCWHQALQKEWMPWQKNMDFDFSVFLPALSSAIYDAFVLMLTKKRLHHKGFTLDSLCNTLNKVQGNQKEALQNNGAGIIANIANNISHKMVNVDPEDAGEIQKTAQKLNELGINNSNCYLYMKGHSIYDLIIRIGKSLFDDSFEYQILAQSFSVENEYLELEKVKTDIIRVI